MNSMLQFILAFLLVCALILFVVLLVRIRCQLLEKLAGVFSPYVWVGLTILKWLWREPMRFKIARGAK